MTNNQIMIDYARKDKRSVSFMLNGQGDGREKLWIKHVNTYQSIGDMEQLIESFRVEVRYGRIRTSNKMQCKSLFG